LSWGARWHLYEELAYLRALAWAPRGWKGTPSNNPLSDFKCPTPRLAMCKLYYVEFDK
jgi:hypothetical protein